MRIVTASDADTLMRRMRQQSQASITQVEPAVRKIVGAVRRDGETALRRYAERWDGVSPGQPLRVSAAEMALAWKAASQPLRAALRQAAANIRRYCRWQKPRAWSRVVPPGVRTGQLVRALDAVGCYVPGGRYPLVSTLLMTVIPAQIAGVKVIRVVSPRPVPETMAAAAMLGVEEFYRVGGAQAIAALAYGTTSIPRVDKIVGPGNLYVTAAKKLVAFDCAIDFLAGPTEVLIVSDQGDPRFIAADLVAQAEHDPDACAIFVTSSRDLAQAVKQATMQAARGNTVAVHSLRRNGLIVLAACRQAALELANSLAPEHITVAPEDVDAVRGAGSVFVGDYSPQAAGDYAAGPNHVLPTAGGARARGGLSVLDFVRLISVQQLSRVGLQQLEPVIATLAEAEGLRAHADSVRVRCARA